MLLLVASRQIFASGDNSYQKLGLNLDVDSISVFTYSDYDFDSIDLGKTHGLGISKDGNLYCWGNNENY